MATTRVIEITELAGWGINLDADHNREWPQVVSRTGRPMVVTRIYAYVGPDGQSNVAATGLRVLHRDEVGRADAQAPWQTLDDMPPWARLLVDEAAAGITGAA